MQNREYYTISGSYKGRLNDRNLSENRKLMRIALERGIPKVLAGFWGG